MKSARTAIASTLLVLSPALLVACSSDNPSVSTPPPSNVFTFDTLNIGLAGNFVPFEQERRAPILDAISGLESDIVCVQEAWRKSDKDLIEEAVKDRFPYVIRYEHNLDTPIDDPKDQNGVVPPAPTVAPCGDPDIKAKFEQVIGCLAKNCSTIPDSEDGTVNSATCAQDHCLAEAAPLLAGTAQEQQCYGCAVTSLPMDTLTDIRQKCTTNPNAALAFDGQSGVMLLSKVPLVDADDWVLPGTWNRRIIIRATAQLPNGVDLDVYCNHLSPIFFDLAYPYTGQYAEGKTGPEGWAAEQLLQVKKLEAYVAEHSGTKRALVLGDFNASHEWRVDGHLVARAEGDASMTQLEASFAEALTPDYVPACTFCSSNSNTGLAGDWESAWIDHLFLQTVPVSAVQSTMRTFEDNVVPVTKDDGTKGMVPISDHYGMRAVVEITP